MRFSLTRLWKALIALSAVVISPAALALLPNSYELSTEVYPVDFTVNNVHFKIPRNYLVYGEINPSFLWVNFPGGRPFTVNQSECHTRDWPIDVPGKCMPVVAELTESNSKNADEHLREALGTEYIRAAHQGPPGFIKYEINPDLAYYTNVIDDRTLYICEKFKRSEKIICNTYANTVVPGVGITRIYPQFFSVERLSEASEIDTELYRLIKGFIVQ